MLRWLPSSQGHLSVWRQDRASILCSRPGEVREQKATPTVSEAVDLRETFDRLPNQLFQLIRRCQAHCVSTDLFEFEPGKHRGARALNCLGFAVFWLLRRRWSTWRRVEMRLKRGQKQVALMVAGVSTGALVGAFTAFLFGRTMAQAPWMRMPPAPPVDALVHWAPSKARRLDCSASVREHHGKEVAVLQQAS